MLQTGSPSHTSGSIHLAFLDSKDPCGPVSGYGALNFAPPAILSNLGENRVDKGILCPLIAGWRDKCGQAKSNLGADLVQ